MSDMKGSLEQLEVNKLLQNRISFLYNLEPAQDNMFICSPIVPRKDSNINAALPHLGEVTDSNKRDNLEVEHPVKKNGKWTTEPKLFPAQTLETASYRLYSAKFSMPKIKTEQFARIRKNIITGVEMNQQFTLEWIEDCFHSVRKYHHDWFNCWYIREADAFINSAKNGKYRCFQIYLYHMIHKDDEIIPHIWGVIDVADAFPIDLGDISVSSDSGNSIYSCTYMANYIDLRFADSTESSFLGSSTDKSILQNMGFSDTEIDRLIAAFTVRSNTGGENFLF